MEKRTVSYSELGWMVTKGETFWNRQEWVRKFTPDCHYVLDIEAREEAARVGGVVERIENPQRRKTEQVAP